MIRAVARKSIPGIMEGLRNLQSPPKSPRIDFFLKRSANCILEVGGTGVKAKYFFGENFKIHIISFPNLFSDRKKSFRARRTIELMKKIVF